ncbi:hypothetical protein CTS44_16128 [Comamonas thiooxydans]|nr:hypothetical protein CTS44_16128 [Comamonas thiooxydans]
MSFRDKQVLKRLVLHDVLFKDTEGLARCDQKPSIECPQSIRSALAASRLEPLGQK